uniref:Uncharacterized protein n=1 Tax=Plectus sambesii TaxID=2011161 RepID=A0A914ULI7_9BILA
MSERFGYCETLDNAARPFCSYAFASDVTVQRSSSSTVVSSSTNVIATTSASDVTELPPKKKARTAILWKPDDRVNVYQYFLDKYNSEKMFRWREFEGRKAATGPKATLYPDLDKKTLTQRGRPNDDIEMTA